MRNITITGLLVTILAAAAGCSAASERERDPVARSSDQLIGLSGTYSSLGAVDPSNPFFQPLGANGRSCGDCHKVDQGWTITPWAIRARFEASEGTDVLFKPHDTAVAPNVDVSTLEARRQAYALILSRGIVRIGLGVPATAEFEVSEIDDPYAFATPTSLSVYRRPLPVSNLAFASTVSWDARLTLPGKTIAEDLAEQANRANKGHGQATTDLPMETRNAIVQFETTTFSASNSMLFVGALDAAGARGGAAELSREPFYLGINSKADPTGKPFDPHSMTIFDAWQNGEPDSLQAWARDIVARGAQIFGEPRLKLADGSRGSCSGCHNTPNVGAGSVSALTFDIGIAEESRRQSDVPLYTLRNKTTGETRKVTDPGRGLITGKWADIGKFKAPSLRDVAARAPYFHDGSAPTLFHVVDHYKDRFHADLDDGDVFALVAFLSAL